MEEYKYSSKKIIKNIAFFGDANISPADETYKAAFDAANELARRGYVIVDGGGPGVMEAATSGAVAGGGKTITITFDPVNAPGFEGKYIKNVGDEEIVTTNYIERMFKLMEYGDIFIIFKGGSGTLSEFGTAWVLAKIYFGHHKPFILFGEHWIPIIDAIKNNMNIDAKEMSVFEIVRTQDELLKAIESFEKKILARNHDDDSKQDEYGKAFTK